MKRIIIAIVLMCTPLVAQADTTDWLRIGEDDSYYRYETYNAGLVNIDGVPCVILTTRQFVRGSGISCNWSKYNGGSGGTQNGATVTIDNNRKRR